MVLVRFMLLKFNGMLGDWPVDVIGNHTQNATPLKTQSACDAMVVHLMETAKVKMGIFVT
jgi:hypothetical protein